jgi:hypothetical protein
MKFTLLAAAGLAATAVALPNNYGDKKYDEHKGDKKYDDHKEEYHHDDGKTHGLSAFPFDFTSTYYVKATPDNMYAELSGLYQAALTIPSASSPTAPVSQDKKAL